MAVQSIKAKSTTWLVATVLVVPVLLIMLVGLQGCDKQTTDTFTCKLGGQWFTLETALDEDKQARGLGGRESIPDDGGMIFVFKDDKERHFWMLDCLVDIDIIYVDRTGFIVSTYTMKAQPLRQPGEADRTYRDRIRAVAEYPSNGMARYVIELRAGRIKELGLKRGDKLDLDLKRLKELADSDDKR